VPTYRVRCKKCNKVFEEFTCIEARNDIKCWCGGEITIVPSAIGLRTTMYGRENKPLVLEHLAKDESIVYVTSKQQLKRELIKHQGISPILD
jgi:hypothetical protein